MYGNRYGVPGIRMSMKTTTTDISEIFEAYGHAAYYAQLIEYDLVSVWLLDSVTQGVSLTRKDLFQFQKEWSRRTLGKLLHPLKKSSLIPDDLKQFLETVRITRNTLAHDLFLSVDCDLRSSSGRLKAKHRLEEMAAILMKGQEFISDVLKVYGKDFGIDYDTIHKEVLNQIE